MLLYIFFGCSERYELQLQRGELIDNKLLKYTKQIISLSKYTILVLEIPHKEDPFIKLKQLALIDEDLNILHIEDFNISILTAKNDTLLCYLYENEKKRISNTFGTKYYEKVITGQNITYNSILLGYRIINKNYFELTIRRCSKNLFFNFEIEKRDTSNIYEFNGYNKTEKLIIKISECKFNEEDNEIEIISLQDTKVEIDKLKLINEIKVNKILRKIVQFSVSD